MPYNRAKTELFGHWLNGDMVIADQGESTGRRVFVCSVTGSDAGGYGGSPDRPVATLDYAMSLCTANKHDIIYVMPGHSEALTTQVSADIAGVRIVGLGSGLDRPEFTLGANGMDGIDVSADGVTIENLYFNEATVSASAANINIDAANCTVRRVHMDMGANDRDGFTITANGEKPVIEDCTCIVTANGPDTWITFEDVVDMPVIRRNYIIGCDGTDAFDDGVLDFGALAITNPIVMDNVFDGADQVLSVLDDVGGVVGDVFAGNRYGGSATDGDTVTLAATTLADDAITAAKIATGAFTADAFAADAIVAATLATDSITADALAADAVAEVADGVCDEALTGHKTQSTVGQSLASVEMCCEKSDGAVLAGDDPIFTIAGGPVHILEISGIVTTNIGAGATNVKLQLDTTTPAATVEMNAGAVDIDADAAGTSYRSINTTGIFTPVTAGFVLMGNSFATNPTEYFAPIGTIQFNSDAARDGVIKWYLRYKPLSPNSVVTAAA